MLLTAPALFAQSKSGTDIKVAKNIEKQEVSLSKKTSATPEYIANKQTSKMVASLGLSKEQTIKVQSLNLKVQQKIDVIKTSRMMEEKKQEFIQGNLNERLKELSTILTKEQFAKYTGK